MSEHPHYLKRLDFHGLMVLIPIFSKSTHDLNYLFLMHHKGISSGHFGIAPMVEDDATNLFEIIEDRTQINSTIITFSFL